MSYVSSSLSSDATELDWKNGNFTFKIKIKATVHIIGMNLGKQKMKWMHNYEIVSVLVI